MLVHVDTDLDRGVPPVLAGRARPIAHSFRPVGKSHILSSGGWGWEQLRDFVNTEIFERFGPQAPIEPTREASIFKGFLARYGTEARAIAEMAFRIDDGMWQGEPITVYRFCINSDPYFADVIAKRLAA